MRAQDVPQKLFVELRQTFKAYGMGSYIHPEHGRYDCVLLPGHQTLVGLSVTETMAYLAVWPASEDGKREQPLPLLVVVGGPHKMKGNWQWGKGELLSERVTFEIPSQCLEAVMPPIPIISYLCMRTYQMTACSEFNRGMYWEAELDPTGDYTVKPD
jgi:hypothetical protein